VLGSAIVAVCNATAPLVRNGPVQFCFSPAIHPADGSYVFTSGVSSSDTYRVIIRYFRLRGFTRMAYIVSTDASGQVAEKATEEALKLPENAGVQMVARTHFNPSDSNMTYAQMDAYAAFLPTAVLPVRPVAAG
jgi:branched-chain amino acid transport system substrate-binding protein